MRKTVFFRSEQLEARTLMAGDLPVLHAEAVTSGDHRHAHSPSVGEADLGIGTNDFLVDTSALADGIRDQITGQVVGYAFTVSRNGVMVEERAEGWARLPVTDEGVPFTIHTDLNVYSVSKTITGVAAMQLIERLGLSPHSPISPWLPATWNRGNGFSTDGISFYDLLTHRSGFDQTIERLNAEDEVFEDLSTNTYEGLQALVEHGIYSDIAESGTVGYAPYAYKNANQSLARILIANMAVASGDVELHEELHLNIATAAAYSEYVNENVFEPAGISESYCYGTSDSSALAYDADFAWAPFAYTYGRNGNGGFPNGLLTCGAKNWNLSAHDLGSFLAHLQFGGLLSSAAREQFDELELGWSATSNSSARPNRYWHGGTGLFSRNNAVQWLPPSSPFNTTTSWITREYDGTAEIRTCVSKLPEGVNVSLVMNSNIRGSSRTPCGVIQTAFDEQGTTPNLVSTTRNNGNERYDTLTSIEYEFDQSVASTVSTDDLRIRDLTTDSLVDLAAVTVQSFDGGRSVRFDMPPGMFSPSLYQVTLLSHGVRNIFGNRLNDGSQDEVHELRVAQRGDINLDGLIDAVDATLLFQNWGGPGDLRWSRGDHNFDSYVDSLDAATLFVNWTGDGITRHDDVVDNLLATIRRSG